MFSAVEILSLNAVSTCVSADEAIRIWRTRPNVVNRRLCGCSEMGKVNTESYENDGRMLGTLVDVIAQKAMELFPQLSLENTDKLIKQLDILSACGSGMELGCNGRDENDKGELHGESGAFKEASKCRKLVDVTFRKLFPRSLKKFKITVEIIATFESTLSVGTAKTIFDFISAYHFSTLDFEIPAKH